MGDFYPEVLCDIVYIDGSPTLATVGADLRNLAARSAPGALLVVAGAGVGTPARQAWSEAEAAGLVEWEGTSMEDADNATSDALVWGRLRSLE